MGYRSTVVIGMNKTAFLMLLDKLKEESETDKNDIIDMLSYAEERSGTEDGSILLAWNGIKWYDNYHSVTFLTDFINEIVNESGDNEPVGQAPELVFKRIGEEIEDTEEMETSDYTNEFGIFFNRQIDYDNNNCDELPKNFFYKAVGIKEKKEEKFK